MKFMLIIFFISGANTENTFVTINPTGDNFLTGKNYVDNNFVLQTDKAIISNNKNEAFINKNLLDLDFF